MPLTLIEAAKSAGNALKAGVINTFAQTSDILRVLPFENINSGAITALREQTLPGVGFRGVNEAFSEDAGVLNPITETLAIMGGDIDVDNFIVKTMPQQVPARIQMKVKAAAHRFTRAFIKGDAVSDPREFDGLQRRISGNQLIDAGATSGGDALSLGKLDQLLDQVDPDGMRYLVMNKTMRRLLSAAARTTAVGGYITYKQDEFGRQQAMYGEVPILICDEDNQGNQILPFTEANPGGGSAASTSIYAISVGPMLLSGIQFEAIDTRPLGEAHDKPVLRTRVEWFASIAAWHGRCAARLRGIKNAAVTA